MIHLGFISAVQYINLHVRSLKNAKKHSLQAIPKCCSLTLMHTHIQNCMHILSQKLWATATNAPSPEHTGCPTCTHLLWEMWVFHLYVYLCCSQWGHIHPGMTGFRLSRHPVALAGQGRRPDVIRRFLAGHKGILITAVCTSRSLPHKFYNLKFCAFSCHLYISFPAQSRLISKVSM